MLKAHVFTVGCKKFGVWSEERHVWWSRSGVSSLCGRSTRNLMSDLRSRSLCGREDEVGFGELAEDRGRMVESCGERSARVVGECNELNVGVVDARVQDGIANLSFEEEMMERWIFLQRLPHKLLRDIGYIIAGPSLLSSSKELPVVSTSMLGGSSSQWPITKSWLQQLSIPAVEAWFAAHRSSQRLGDHFALCIEYVLRHSPHVKMEQLLTSQQVLERVTEPVRSSRALRALESKLMAQTNKTSMSVSTDKPLSVCVGPNLQGEQQQVYRPDESFPILDLNDRGILLEKVGKRKRKLLKKLERVRLCKGNTTTIGEFDFLFEIPADNLKGKEFHHWEVSVKYLLYAGPWEVFGVRSPQRLGEDSCTSQEHPREVDNFLGCYLGPHVGETLLDRKARLCNQLALSANPCAALMLRDLFTNKGADEIAEDSDGGSNNEGIEDVVMVPSALLKGYLFYEYKLWRFLERRNVGEASLEEGSSASGYTQNHGVSSENEDEVICQGGTFKGLEIQDSQRASLNTNHWKGWWTRDIMEFGDLPAHRHSKWYIVPKLEWLSPVVIPQWDTDRCARVLSLAHFLVTAAQVADEAARLLMPRKRRFLVAEVRWRSDWEACGEREEEGAWVEVSRGFVVEDTWPDTRMYSPHGYVASWSPSLQVEM